MGSVKDGHWSLASDHWLNWRIYYK